MHLRLVSEDGRDADGTETFGIQRERGGTGGACPEQEAPPGLTLYEFGYRGWRLGDIARATASPAPGIIVVDIRFAVPRAGPRSAGWFAAGLQGRYRHIRALGNPNFRGGPIRLLDEREGLRSLLDLNRLHPGRLALMCACPRYEACHRRAVVEALERRGIPVAVRPLPEPPTAEQGGLF